MTTSMRTIHIIAIVLIMALLLLSLTYILAIDVKIEKLEHLSSPSPTGQNFCGPWAFFVAITRQGIPSGFSKVVRELPITDTGISFGDIVKQAQKQGFSTKLARLSWHELKIAGTLVILWVDGNHFLTVDPREAHPEGKDMVRLYDYGRPATWYSRSQLENRWTGESLVIRKSNSTFLRTGPKLRWETCLEDFGWVDPYEKRRLFKYAFENVGDQPLELSVAKVGCGCARADIAPKVVAPGERGLVTVTVDVSKKRGYFSTSVLLNTNDTSLPKCEVIVSGGVFQPILASIDKLYLGHVHRGTNLAESFYVQDRGNKTLQIKDLKAVLDKKLRATEYISCEVKSTYIQANNMPKNPVSRYPVKVGDYLVDLRLQISPNAPIGPFAGKVLIETNQPGRSRSGVVTFKGTVITDVYAEPQALLLSRREPTARIRLKSKLHDKVEIPSLPPTMSGDANLLIKTLGTSSSSPAYEVLVAEFKDTGIQNTQIVFHLNDKSSVAVPVIVYNGSQ